MFLNVSMCCGETVVIIPKSAPNFLHKNLVFGFQNFLLYLAFLINKFNNSQPFAVGYYNYLSKFASLASGQFPHFLI